MYTLMVILVLYQPPVSVDQIVVAHYETYNDCENAAYRRQDVIASIEAEYGAHKIPVQASLECQRDK